MTVVGYFDSPNGNWGILLDILCYDGEQPSGSALLMSKNESVDQQQTLCQILPMLR